MGRDREGPKLFLANFEGLLQTDGYAAYDHGVGGAKMVHAACWSHARRYFVDAIKLNKQDAVSVRIVALMDELFDLNAGARDEKMDHAARHAMRLKEAPQLLDKIDEQILAMSHAVLPKSAAGKACGYALRLWKRLTLFLEHPELERNGQKKLDTHRKPTGRTPGGGYPLSG
jgi:transposase